MRKHGENGAEMVVPLRGPPPVHVLEHALAWAEESLVAAMKQEGWQRKMKEAMQGAHGLTQEQVGRKFFNGSTRRTRSRWRGSVGFD